MSQSYHYVIYATAPGYEHEYTRRYLISLPWETPHSPYRLADFEAASLSLLFSPNVLLLQNSSRVTGVNWHE